MNLPSRVWLSLRLRSRLGLLLPDGQGDRLNVSQLLAVLQSVVLRLRGAG